MTTHRVMAKDGRAVAQRTAQRYRPNGLSVAASLAYRAVFAGDDVYLPSDAVGPLVTVRGQTVR